MKRCRWVMCLVLALAVPVVSMAARVPSKRLDPLLLPLLTRPTHQVAAFRGMLREGRLPILVRTTGDPRRLESLGLRVHTVVGNIASADVDPAQIGILLDAPDVVYVEGPRLMRPSAPMLDKSVPLVGADAVRRSSPAYTGRNVIVGVIDTGLDVAHPAFRTPQGATRVLAVWDQIVTTPGRTPPESNYGTEWSSDDVEAGRAVVRDVSGHGTHVAGIAAGNGRSDDASSEDPAATSPYIGVAPQANVIAVRTTFLTPDVLDAAAYIVIRARQFGMPAVINMSFGNTWGAHDGRGLLSEGMGLLLRGTTGLAMVAAAGNDGDTNSHARIVLRDGDPPKHLYLRPDFEADAVYVEAWHALGGSAQVRPLFPVNNAGDLGDLGFPWVAIDEIGIGIAPVGPAKGLEAFVAYTASPDLYPDLAQISLSLARAGDYAVPLDANLYALEFEGNGVIDAFAHFGRFVERAEDPGSVTPDNQYTVASPAEGDGIIAVGSVVSSDSWQTFTGETDSWDVGALGSRSVFSSMGPRRDGGQKPDVSAPGEFVVSPLSRDALFAAVEGHVTPDGEYVVMRGTSMASAHVTGLVALLLQQNPQMTSESIVARVRDAGIQGAWTPEVGTGIVDAPRLLNVPRPVSGLRVQVAGSELELRWNASPESDVTAYRVTIDGTTTDAGGVTQLRVPVPNADQTATVTAVNRAGRQSAPSDAIVLTAAGSRPGKPTDVRVRALDGSVALTWRSVPNATGYIIAWGVAVDALNETQRVTGATALVEGLRNGTRYFFAVRAIGTGDTDGVQSDVVHGTARTALELAAGSLSVRVGFPVEASHDLMGGPAVADVDGDGFAEIFAAGFDGNVYAWRHDGTGLAGWPIDTGDPIVDTVAIGDLEGDGALEIVAASGRRLFVWTSAGENKRGFPAPIDGEVRAHPVLANLDEDPALEILVSVVQRNPGVYAWDAAGDPIDGYPLSLPATEYVYTAPVVADTLLDGVPEVHVGAAWGPVYAWEATGQELEGYPALPEGGLGDHATPIATALRDSDVALVFTGRTAGLVAYGPAGDLLPGFPAPLMTQSNAGASVGDVDGDGEPEVLVVDGAGLLFAWHIDGTVVRGYPVKLLDDAPATPLIADLDGDGAAEIIAVGNERSNFGSVVYILSGDGSVLAHARLDVNIMGTPTLADLDGDGNAELVATTLRRQASEEQPDEFPALGGRLFVWDTPYAIHRADWITHQADVARSGVAPFGMPPPAVITDLSALRKGSTVELAWTGSSERGILGWRVLRSTSPGRPFEPLFDRLIRSTAPGPNVAKDYSATDANADTKAAYYYQIEAVGSMSRRSTSATLAVASLAESTLLTTWGEVKDVEVLAPFPSPANPEVWVPFALGKDADVALVVHDPSGRTIRRVDLGLLTAGSYVGRSKAAHWNGRNEQGEPVASGLYFVELVTATASSELRRVYLLK